MGKGQWVPAQRCVPRQRRGRAGVGARPHLQAQQQQMARACIGSLEGQLRPTRLAEPQELGQRATRHVLEHNGRRAVDLRHAEVRADERVAEPADDVGFDGELRTHSDRTPRRAFSTLGPGCRRHAVQHLDGNERPVEAPGPHLGEAALADESLELQAGKLGLLSTKGRDHLLTAIRTERLSAVDAPLPRGIQLDTSPATSAHAAVAHAGIGADEAEDRGQGG